MTAFFTQEGELISPHLGCCDGLAVQYHSFTHRRLPSVAISARELSLLLNLEIHKTSRLISFTHHAYHLRQTRLVNQPDYLEIHKTSRHLSISFPLLQSLQPGVHK